ncbi:MAG: TolC family protein [Desulfobacteraceae bacterium]|nr:TolC family protein [Desulfobacteraceae bacterium]
MRLLTIITALLMGFISSALAADDTLQLTLKDSIRMAVEKNLDVRAELYNPAQFEADIRRNYSIYDPLLTLGTNYTNSTTPLATSFLTGTSKGEVNTLNANAGISYTFWTGGNVAFDFNNAYTETNSSHSLGNYWQSSLGATITQPLLKNQGREATEININISRLSKFASIERFNTRLLNTIAQVRNEYFQLYNLREQVEVKKVSHELALKILSETKARVDAGVLPAMEILNAEYGAVSREKDLIDAEKAVSDQVDVLHLLLQIEGRGDISTVDHPSRDLMEVSEDDSLKRALNRQDIREQKRNLEIAELQTRVFDNNTRPDLSLVASTSFAGLDRTYPRDFEKVASIDYPTWSVGLNFTYPLGNDAAENDYRKSRLKTEQTALQIRSLEEGAANEVKAAIRAVTTGYKQIEVADRGRAFAEERLRAFIRKNEVGLATTKDVLDVENDLATAKSNQISAVVGYNNAITRLWQVTGELLEREGVRVVEADADKLYKNTR